MPCFLFRRALPYAECRKAVGLGYVGLAIVCCRDKACLVSFFVGRCPTLSATRPLALDVLAIVCCGDKASLSLRIVIYSRISYPSLLHPFYHDVEQVYE